MGGFDFAAGLAIQRTFDLIWN